MRKPLRPRLRDRHTARATQYVQRLAWLPAVAVLSSLAGCQLFVAQVPERATNEAPSSAAAAPPVTKHKLPPPPAAQSLPIEAKLDRPPLLEPANDDLLLRLREALALPVVENPAVQLELVWYRSHPDYLDRLFNRADRYLYYIVNELDLPVETRAYVPRLLAIQALMADPAAHAVTLPNLPNAPHFEVVATDGQIDMALAAELAGITTDQLYGLNPGVNRWATDPDGPHRLLVPVDHAARLTEALAKLGDRERVEWSRHEVRAGETLGQLAQRYRTTTAVLSEVNSLTGNLIRIGQPLMIPHAVNGLNAYTQSVEARLERRQNQTRDGQRQTHDVRPGESLWSISQVYGVGVRELAVWNGMAPGDVLSVGRQLVIWSDRVTAVPAPHERIRRINYGSGD